MSISIVLADDHPIVRQGLRRLLETESDLVIVGESADGLETVRVLEKVQPDVVILDLMMPGLSGLDVVPIAKQRSPRTGIIMYSMHAREELVLQAFRQGAHAFLDKNCDPIHIVEAVRKVAAGSHYLGPALACCALAAFQEKAAARPPDPHEQLTARERQVLQLAAEGFSSPEIGARLSISPRTVEMHRANSMRKLQLKSQTDLIRYAIRRGMIST